MMVSAYALEFIYIPTLIRHLLLKRVSRDALAHMLPFISAARFKIRGDVDKTIEEAEVSEMYEPLVFTQYVFDVWTLAGNGVHNLLSQS